MGELGGDSLMLGMSVQVKSFLDFTIIVIRIVAFSVLQYRCAVLGRWCTKILRTRSDLSEDTTARWCSDFGCWFRESRLSGLALAQTNGRLEISISHLAITIARTRRLRLSRSAATSLPLWNGL